MNPWEARFNDHSLWAAVDRLEENVNQLPAADGTPELEAEGRLRSILELLKEYREHGSKELFSDQMLTRVQSTLVGATSGTTNYLADPSGAIAELTSAANSLDGALDHIATWPPLPAPGQARAAGRTFKEYDKAAREALDDLNDYYTKLSASKKVIEDELSTLKSQVGDTLDRVQTSLEERETEYTDAIKTVELSGQEAYDSAIERDVESRRLRLDTLVEAATKQAERAEAAANSAAEQKKNSETAANWISEQAIATDFGRQARRKSAAGWFYDILGAVTGGVPLILILKHFLEDSTPDADAFAISVARASVTIAALVIAAYLFSRGAANHRQARNSKSADIRLRLLEAFISRLTDEEAAEIRRGMAETIFLRGKLSEEEAEKTHSLVDLFSRRSSSEPAEEPSEKSA